MKKLLFVVTAVIILCISASAFAASSSISVKNNEVNSSPITYTYDSGSSGEIVKSIKSLMTKLEELSRQDSVVQTITISSLRAGAKPVNFKLRLTLPEKNSSDVKPEKLATPSPDEFKALDYYNIKITTANGDVLYDGNESAEDTEQKNYKDIPLGTLNREEAAENRIYNITISENKDLKKDANILSSLRRLDWCIVSDTYDMGNIVSDNETTEKEQPTNETDEQGKKETGDTADKTPAPSATSNADATGSADSNINKKLDKGEYIAGTDIPAGRYKITGDGKVSLYTADDILKMTILLKHKGDTESKGVEEYVMNVQEGEKLKVDNEVTLTPHKAQSMLPTPTPKATPSTASSSSGANKNNTSSSSSTRNNTSTGSKTNPKTGDTTPVAVIIIIGIVSLAGACVIEVKKRRINK